MKDTPNTLTPRLRFPEFKDRPGWTAKRLGDLVSLVNDRVGDSDCMPYTVTSGVGLVRQQDRFGRTIAGNSLRSYVLLRRDDFAYNKSATKPYPQGFIARYTGDERAAVPNSIFTCFRPQSDEVDPAYLDYLFAGNLHGRWLRRLITVGARAHGALNVNDTDLLSVPIPLPVGEKAAAEQRKIAAFLTSLDEWIVAEGRKLEALQGHKQGLMQQLFPREGETRPRLRFPDFQAAPDWEAKVGGDLFANRKDDGEEGLPIYSVTVNEGMVPRASFDRDFYDIKDPAGNKKACKGDIAYNMMRMWQGAQGVAVEDCMVSPAYVVLAPLKDVSSEFFAFLFKLPQSLHLLTSHSRGLTKDRLRLYFDDFRQVSLRVPQFPEQRRIAACLSSVDALIAAQSRKLDSLRALKKGLIQQLFPSLEGL